jgi:hypothetical protein
MALAKAFFKINAVRLHLSKSFPYACTCFGQDMAKYGYTDTVSSAHVERWFKSYFPSEVAYTEYRRLEANVTQTVQF